MAVRTERRAVIAPAYVRWGPVFAGAIIGLAILFLANSLWMALATGSDMDFVGRNVHWFGLASALVALYAGGLIAGWMTGVRGIGAGLVTGLTVWGLVLIGTLVLGVPESLDVFGFTAAPLSEWGADPLWATFWSLIGGLAVAVAGGTVGAGLPGYRE
jgi:peptidoglycan/LPS O-acetylase OafA/YrhL